MSTLFVSDLHIGDNKSGYQEFFKFLQGQEDVEKLIVVGDLFDFWVDKLGNVLSKAQSLLEYIQGRFGSNVCFLLGNHEEDLRPLIELHIVFADIYEFTVNDMKGIALHGHFLDPDAYLKYLPRTARFNAWLINKTDALFHMDLRKFLVKLSDYYTNDFYDMMLRHYEMNLKDAYGTAYNFIITGHTHRPCIKQLSSSCVYLNCGDGMQHRTVLKQTLEGFYLIDYSTDPVVIDSYLFEAQNGNPKTAIQNEGSE